jgi:hypothetical protein
MSLNRFTAMREIDGLSLVFIYFYVPAFTSWLRRIEAAVQLSEILTFFAICGVETHFISKDG